MDSEDIAIYVVEAESRPGRPMDGVPFIRSNDRYQSCPIRTLITMDGERNHSMGNPMDGTPPQSEDQ